MDYVIDEETGLPVLPEGFFWRVYKSHSNSKHYRVGVFYRTWLGRRKLVHREAWSAGSLHKISPEDIRDTAHHALRQWDKHTGPESDDWKSLLGDYPPKKLYGGSI